MFIVLKIVFEYLFSANFKLFKKEIEVEEIEIELIFDWFYNEKNLILILGIF